MDQTKRPDPTDLPNPSTVAAFTELGLLYRDDRAGFDRAFAPVTSGEVHPEAFGAGLATEFASRAAVRASERASADAAEAQRAADAAAADKPAPTEATGDGDTGQGGK